MPIKYSYTPGAPLPEACLGAQQDPHAMEAALVRIHRAFGKLGMWQCMTCAELFLPHEERVLNFCSGCWCVCEDLADYYDFSTVPAAQLAKIYRRLVHTLHLGDYLAGAAGPARLGEIPPQVFLMLTSLQRYFGDARIIAALRAHGGRGALIYLHANALEWDPAAGLRPKLTDTDRINMPMTRPELLDFWQRLIQERAATRLMP